MNVTQTWKNGQGRRNTVIIRNGKGKKRVERLGGQGQVLEMQAHTLSPTEVQDIAKGRFIKGLWQNCRLGNC